MEGMRALHFSGLGTILLSLDHARGTASSSLTTHFNLSGIDWVIIRVV